MRSARRWVRTDDKISVAALSKPGFELQWKSKLDNQPRGVQRSRPGRDGERRHAVRADVGRRRQLEQRLRHRQRLGLRRLAAALRRAAAGSDGGVRRRHHGGGDAHRQARRADAADAVRRVRRRPRRRRLSQPARRAGRRRAGRRPCGRRPDALAIRPALRRRRGARGADPAGAAGSRRRACAAGGDAAHRRSSAFPARRAAEEDAGGAFGFLFRPSGVGYVVSSDGMLHVLGLPSGKDMQKPAPFLPANARWSAPSPSTRRCTPRRLAGCGGAPSGVWAIDLDSEAKPVVSWKTNGGDVVGAVAFTPDGTLIAAIGRGQATGDGKANAIVALDPKTLQVKDWFTQPDAEFVTGPTIFRHNDKDIVAAATQGRPRPAARRGVARRRRITRRRCSSRRPCSAPARRSALTRWPRGRSQGSQLRRPARARLLNLRRRRAAVDPGSGCWPHRGRCVVCQRRGLERGRGGAEADRQRRCAVARAGLGFARPRVARDAAHRQRRGVRAGDWCAGGAGREGRRRGSARLRRRHRQAAVDERQGDDDACVARQHLERARAGLRRHAATARSTRSASTTSGARSRRLGRSDGQVHHRHQFTPSR